MQNVFTVLFFLLSGGVRLLAQTAECNTYYPLIDSIGEPFVKEIILLREIGMNQNDKDIGLPHDRLLQYPYFIPYVDKENLFNNYEKGFYAYIDAFSLIKDSLKNQGIVFKEGVELNSKMALQKGIDTIRQSVKFAKRGSYRKVKKLFFEYAVYKLKIRAVYIGKYCRRVPDSIIGKNKPMFNDESLDVYVVLDIEQ